MSAHDSESPVLIVGAGPVGLALALGLAHHGVRSTVVEKQASISEHSKAPGLHARTLEIFGQWGIAGEVLHRARFLPTLTPYAGATGEPLGTLPIEELSAECRFAGLGILEQAATERLLLAAVRASGRCEVRFSHEAVHLDQTEEGVTVTVRHEGAAYEQEARFLVGCDGAGSTVRDLLDLSLDGHTYPVAAVLADVRLDDARDALPFPRLEADGEHIMLAVKLESGDWRVICLLTSDPEHPDRPVRDDEIERILTATLGAGGFERVWASRFRLHRRCVPRFRVGRVLLAGDAAHLNSPVGGQGMNAGIQDAHNLAWKLAAILHGADEERLLESYHAERHDAVTREVNRRTDLFTRAVLAPPVVQAVGGAVAPVLLSVKPVRRYLLRRVTMLATRYRRSPLLAPGATAERVPDVELRGPSGRRRLHELLGTDPALLFLDRPPVEIADVRAVGIGEGGWDDPSGLLAKRFGRDRVLLVRPDHFVGWSGAPRDRAALERAVRAALGRSTLGG